MPCESRAYLIDVCTNHQYGHEFALLQGVNNILSLRPYHRARYPREHGHYGGLAPAPGGAASRCGAKVSFGPEAVEEADQEADRDSLTRRVRAALSMLLCPRAVLCMHAALSVLHCPCHTARLLSVHLVHHSAAAIQPRSLCCPVFLTMIGVELIAITHISHAGRTIASAAMCTNG